MMDVDRRSNLQHEPMSECRSFGSNHLPCSLSRKMSIGIVIDSSAKSRSQNVKENEAAAPALESITTSKGKPVEERNNQKELLAPRQAEAPEKENSPWVSTRSFYQKLPTSEAIHDAEQTPNLPARTEMSHRSYAEKDATAKYSVQFSANGKTHSKSNERKQEKVNTVTYRRKEKKDVTAEGVQKFESASAQKVVLEKEVVEGMFNKAGNRGTETLRLKLWEILEPVSSGNKNCINSQDLIAGAIHPEQKDYANGNPTLSARRNSDVIESDSERSNHTVRRQTTHSLARNKAPARQRQKQVKKSPATCYKEDHLRKNIFSFKHGCYGRLSGAFNDKSLTSIGKKSRASCGVEGHESSHEVHNVKENNQGKHRGKKVLPNEKSSLKANEGDCKKSSMFMEINSRNLERDVHQTPPRKTIEMQGNIMSPTFQEDADQHELSDAFNENSLTSNGKKSRSSFGVERHESFHEVHNIKEKNQGKNRGRRVLPAEKSSSRGNEGRCCEKSSMFTEVNSGHLEREVHQTPPRKTIQKQGDIGSPTFQEAADQHEGLCHSPLKDMSQMKYQHHSPNLEMNKPFRRSSFASSPKTKLGKLDSHSPADTINCRGFQSFKEFLISNSDHVRSNAQGKSVNVAGDLEDYPSADSTHVAEEDSENMASEASDVERDSENSEESLQKEGYDSGFQHTGTLYPDIVTPVKPNSLSPPNKRLRNQKNPKVTDFSSASASPEGAEESDKVQEQLELNQEDGLAGAVTLFALALERVKSKVKSVTQQKSAEILMYVAEEVHSQLKNAESQIQADVGKLAGRGKTKRKRLETRLQDLQGQLNVTYERFKEAVNQHLQECRSTLEGLEAYDTEVKRTMEKQRVSHRKILLQAEETIENQLNDAQIRISTVLDLARGKMVQLKNILAECLGEGIAELTEFVGQGGDII